MWVAFHSTRTKGDDAVHPHNDFNRIFYKYVRNVKRLKDYKAKIELDITDIIRWNHVTRSTFALFTPRDITQTPEQRIRAFKKTARKYFPENPYIFVVEEFQKGGFHIHAIIFNVKRLSENALAETNDGLVFLKELTSPLNTAKYLAKYVTKSRATKRAYYVSKIIYPPY